jgi:quercetin dioxygenase-like cupin family protein
MKYIKSDEGQLMPVAFLAKRKFSSSQLEIVEFDLKAGEKIDLHEMPMPVMFYVLSGNAWALTVDNKFSVQAGDMLFFEPIEQRGWMCDNQQQVKLLVIKSLS